MTHPRSALARIAPTHQESLQVQPKRARKPQTVEIGRVSCWNPHVAGALALAMRQGQTVRATYAAGTITLTTETGK
jgi:hypothetical protein